MTLCGVSGRQSVVFDPGTASRRRWRGELSCHSPHTLRGDQSPRNQSHEAATILRRPAGLGLREPSRLHQQSPLLLRQQELCQRM